MFENDAGEMMFLDYADGSQYEVTVQRVLGGQNVFITVMSEKVGGLSLH